MTDQEDEPLFDPGDVVVLKAGSPPMTINVVEEREPGLYSYNVIWVDTSYHLQMGTVPEHVLCETYPIHFCCPDPYPDEDDEDPDEQWKKGHVPEEEEY